ncbi:hypothetical protein M501DRAFT_1000998 [Patellaria atrata CBS 101060]|uniref:Uncharacterized protein n=1 Tax=Patellaria atrata CBS 101060 TaxID=1346257 RepID=A0A9P4SG15_9PEZI|nr:hypothetical protein M501DRAFT_1000998 [Patellaria atrata CBS 101060]
MEMVESCRACRICIVRRRDVLSNESVRIITSIWVFSDDRTVRMQQKRKTPQAVRYYYVILTLTPLVADGIEAIPYASYFSPEKISIAIPTEIKFHDSHYDAKPLKVVKTNWINYVFSNERSANLFQAEIFGRSLLGSYKTEKTLRIHDGFSGVLAYQEQMCALENLRLWEDEGTSGVLAMIHFSAHFRNGYLAFYLNSSSTPVRVKDEGGKEVKIKGLSIPLTEQGKMQRRSSVTARRASEDRKRVICGARVEFATENEKMSFLAKVKEVQRTMIALPDL